MRYRKTEIWKSVDWITILLYLIMIIAGWFSICGASYEFDNVGLFDPSGRPGMQMIWIGTSLALIFVILMLESDFFDIFAYLPSKSKDYNYISLTKKGKQKRNDFIIMLH